MKPGGHYVKENKPVTKGQILYDPTSVTYGEELNSWRLKIEWFAGGWEVGEDTGCLRHPHFQLEDEKF